jgi:hypothetical protein
MEAWARFSSPSPNWRVFTRAIRNESHAPTAEHILAAFKHILLTLMKMRALFFATFRPFRHTGKRVLLHFGFRLLVGI